jgi:hypothetical protein
VSRHRWHGRDVPSACAPAYWPLACSAGKRANTW